mmetsp:Transcript_31867/g.74498  ORF Transcript_31867/g.74498 Transcript_31867/m.74498 type:complete len:125 (-) Transcript_31867:756-1130(-)
MAMASLTFWSQRGMGMEPIVLMAGTTTMGDIMHLDILMTEAAPVVMTTIKTAMAAVTTIIIMKASDGKETTTTIEMVVMMIAIETHIAITTITITIITHPMTDTATRILAAVDLENPHLWRWQW